MSALTGAAINFKLEFWETEALRLIWHFIYWSRLSLLNRFLHWFGYFKSNTFRYFSIIRKILDFHNFAFWVLRFAFLVLRFEFCVLRFEFCVLSFARDMFAFFVSSKRFRYCIFCSILFFKNMKNTQNFF